LDAIIAGVEVHGEGPGVLVAVTTMAGVAVVEEGAEELTIVRSAMMPLMTLLQRHRDPVKSTIHRYSSP